jgi:flagellar biogenesis protein FliO
MRYYLYRLIQKESREPCSANLLFCVIGIEMSTNMRVLVVRLRDPTLVIDESIITAAGLTGV